MTGSTTGPRSRTSARPTSTTSTTPRTTGPSDTRYTWAVCEPSTGELLAEITLDPKSSYMHSRARPGHEDAAAMAEDTVRLYASEVLGLRVHT